MSVNEEIQYVALHEHMKIDYPYLYVNIVITILTFAIDCSRIQTVVIRAHMCERQALF